MSHLNISGANAARAGLTVGGATDKPVGNNQKGKPSIPFSSHVGSKGLLGEALIENLGEILDGSQAAKVNTAQQVIRQMLPDDILEKALRDADVEVTAETMNIVKSLINGSLPLTDKNILELYTASNVFESASIDILALMMRLEVPITEENIAAFTALASGHGKLADTLNAMIETLVDIPVENTTPRELADKILTLVRAVTYDSGSEAEVAEKTEEPSRFFHNNGEKQTTTLKLVSPPLNRADQSVLLTQLRKMGASDDTLRLVAEAVRGGTVETTENNSEITSPAAKALNIIAVFIGEAARNSTLSAGELFRRLDTGENRPLPELKQTAYEDLLKNLKEFLENPAFAKLLKTAVSDKLFLNPTSGRDTDFTEFFNQMNVKLAQIENAAKQVSSEKTAQETAAPHKSTTAESAKAARGMIHFMDDVSKTLPFMHIPVKILGKNTQSELYILKNKKKKVGGDEGKRSIFALLRMDLESLGSLDVNLCITGKNVKARFCPMNAAYAKEIDIRLPELSKALAELGYNFTGNAEEGEAFDFLADFINREFPKHRENGSALNWKI
ncbi:hypothetical protein FACS1894219_03610 [Clostridia bacterium]|nr:hypothetical protein FACS1894219_03610 [Clostridia bacterium]